MAKDRKETAGSFPAPSFIISSFFSVHKEWGKKRMIKDISQEGDSGEHEEEKDKTKKAERVEKQEKTMRR